MDELEQRILALMHEIYALKRRAAVLVARIDAAADELVNLIKKARKG